MTSLYQSIPRSPATRRVGHGWQERPRLANRMFAVGAVGSGAEPVALFAAEEESEIIGMAHVMKAIRREYMKLGNHYYKHEMGPYYLLGLPPWAKPDPL